MTGKGLRLSRLFSMDGKAVVVAIDHGQTFGPAEGLINFTEAAENLKEADGVLLAPQMIRFSGNLFSGKGSPVVISRTNWNSIHCEPWGYRQANIVPVMSAREAIREGAEILLASLVLNTGDEKHDAENVRGFAQCVSEAHDLGIPLIGEVFPVAGFREDPERFHDYIKKMCRIICELGADAIKTFYTGERFGEVVEGTPIPIFTLGAEKYELEMGALKLASQAVKAGAKGVVFGRNVIQARNPSLFLKGLKEVVAGAEPEQAAEKYGLH